MVDRSIESKALASKTMSFSQKMQLMCTRISLNPRWQNFILIVIIVSSVQLSLGNPKASQDLLNGMWVADVVFIVIFQVTEFVDGILALLIDLQLCRLNGV